MPKATASEPAPNAQSRGESQKPTIPAESPRRSQIAAESTQLLAMAVELKAAVDKTNKDTLSLNVIRKADAIEKLAKTVRGKTKQGAGPG
jgi:nitric oxide reductase activation protein